MIAETAYKKRGKYTLDMGQVLTIYQPFAPGSEGRPLMLEGDRAKISSEMINQLSTISDKLEASLDSIVLSALGTRDACFQSRYYTRMNKVAFISSPSLSACHTTVFRGLPCAESAVSAARKAANRALKIKSSAKKIFSTDKR